MKTILALVVLVLPIAALVAASRALPVLGGGRPRPGSIRLLAGAAGLAILFALVVGTLRSTAAVGGPEPGGSGEVLLPAKAAPPPAKSAHEVAGRFLVSLVVVDEELGVTRPARLLGQVDLRFPKDVGRHESWSFRSNGNGVNLDLAFKPPQVASGDKIRFLFDYKFETSFLSGSGGHGFLCPAFAPWSPFDTVVAIPLSGWSRPLLSLVPRRAPHAITMQLSAVRVADDDPLKKVPFAEFARDAGIPERLEPWVRTSRDGPLKIATGGFVLAAHAGLSAVLLLAAGLLISQLFPLRLAAAPAVLVALVLAAAALDRQVLEVQVVRLQDPAVAVEERGLALDSLESSFFFRETARAAARKVAEDPAAPDLLRERSKTVIDRLDGWY